ncbi:ABC transporter permease [Roseovarius pacificus]|uniref:ABC transporter permease n=1 Tax=Roseovarius pacificus TaxID=337701 RepID=UPI0037486B16
MSDYSNSRYFESIGLRRSQIIGQVAMEYGILTAFGALIGVLVGTLAAVLFVPMFRVSRWPGRPAAAACAHNRAEPDNHAGGTVCRFHDRVGACCDFGCIPRRLVPHTTTGSYRLEPLQWNDNAQTVK